MAKGFIMEYQTNLHNVLVQDYRTEIVRLYGDFPTDADISAYFRIPKYIVEDIRNLGVLTDEDGLLDRGIDLLKVYSWCFHSKRFLISKLKRYSKTERLKLLEGCEKNKLQRWIEGRIFNLKAQNLRINKEQLFKETLKYFTSLRADSSEDRRLFERYVSNAKRLYFRKQGVTSEDLEDIFIETEAMNGKNAFDTLEETVIVENDDLNNLEPQENDNNEEDMSLITSGINCYSSVDDMLKSNDKGIVEEEPQSKGVFDFFKRS